MSLEHKMLSGKAHLVRTKYSQNASESVEVVVKKLLSSSADFVEAF